MSDVTEPGTLPSDPLKGEDFGMDDWASALAEQNGNETPAAGSSAAGSSSSGPTGQRSAV